MATFTITTQTNIDSLVGRVGGDTYTINGGTLIIDEDSRYGLNASTSATIGAITPSSAVGGSCLVDGRAIWLIPYTGGSGNVPACNTTISKSSASGLLIGVYSALNVAPTAVGAGMPATGYIKVKQWNGVLYGTGSLTGITATAASGENVGWIEPVGQESALATFSSLDQTYGDGSFIKGDWYKVGTTDGNRSTSYQIPTNGSLVWHGAVMVDKAAATTITAATWSAGVATFTSTAHGLTTDDRVFVGVDISPRTWRTVDTQRCTVVDANTFTIPMASNPGAYVSGGKVAAQEWWPITDSLNTKVGSEDYRGKFAWLDSTTGLLRFGNDNTTSTGGVCPTTGRVIRLPNVMSAIATVATKTANNLASSVGTRWRYYNGNAGTIKVDHVSGSWSPSVFQTGKSVTMSDCAVVNQISISTQASTCTLTNVAVGGNGSTSATSSLNLGSYNPVVVTDSVFSVGETAGRSVVSLSTNYNASFDRCRFVGTGDRTAGVYCVNANIGNGATFTRCSFGGNLGLHTASQYANVSMSNCSYYSSAYGFNPLASPTATINLSNLSYNSSFTDFTLYGSTPLARNSLLTAASGSDNYTIRNWGTYASPIDMRLNGFQTWKAWTRVTTTATVTETGHPYRVGDQCMVVNSSNTVTLTVTVKTISAVTANTFDIPAVNSGPASGNVSYYVGNMANVLALSGVSNGKIQNVHVRGNYAAPTSLAASQFGLVLDNFSSEPFLYAIPPAIASNNTQARSYYGSDYPAISGTAATFGTHFAGLFLREPGTAVPGQSAAVTGVSWTRSSTVCTVTSTAHGIVGNLQRIWVENSSSPAAVANGWGASATTLVVDDANTFHFTCLNAGAASGTLDYWLHGDSTLRLMMNEQSSSTVGQAVATPIGSNPAGFTGAGTMALASIGDQTTWETPNLIFGHDSLAHPPAIPYGNSMTTLATAQQFDVEYALDRGSGFGAWRNAAWQGDTGGGWGTSGSTAVTVTKSTGIQVDDYCMGVGIAQGAKFVSRNPGKLAMSGASSSAQTPNASVLQISGAITIDVKVNMANWSSGSTMALVSKVNSGITAGYCLRMGSTGGLSLFIANTTATSSVSLTTVLTNGVASWIRAVWDGSATTKFYTSPDGTTWTQLGTTQAQVTANTTTTDIFYIGQRTTGNDRFTGDIYQVRVYSDATQTTKVFDADFSTNSTGASTLTESANSAVITTVGCQEVTLSVANAAAVSGILTWWYQPNETSFPSTGVKFRVRVTANSAQAATFLQVDVPLISSSTSRTRLYPQTTSVTLALTAKDNKTLAVLDSARVYIVADTGGALTAGTLIATGLTNSLGVYTATFGYSADQPITGWVRKASPSDTIKFKQSQIAGTITSTGFTSTQLLVRDE